jgi:hypothetical protein
MGWKEVSKGDTTMPDEKNVTFDDLDSLGRSQCQRILYMLYDFTNLGKPLELTKSDCNLLRVILGNPQNVDYSAYEKALKG